MSSAKKARIELRRSRKKFVKQLADNIKKDAKSFYAYVGSRSKAVSKLGPLVDAIEAIVSTEQELAEEFNAFFTTVFTREDASSVPSLQQLFCQYVELSDVHVDNQVVRKKLDKLRYDKAPGADDMHPRYPKEIAEEIYVVRSL